MGERTVVFAFENESHDYVLIIKKKKNRNVTRMAIIINSDKYREICTLFRQLARIF